MGLYTWTEQLQLQPSLCNTQWIYSRQRVIFEMDYFKNDVLKDAEEREML